MVVISCFKSRIRLLGVLSLVMLGLLLSLVCIVPSSAQQFGAIAPLLPGPTNSPSLRQELSAPKATSGIERRGDIAYTTVFFRDKPLFNVTAKIDPNSPTASPDTAESASPVALRAQAIKNNLQILLNAGFNPETLQVYPSILGKGPVIVASDPPKLEQQVIVTVTTLDAQIAQTISADELAKQWADIIRTNLIQAWQEDQPAARQARRNEAIKIGGFLLSISFLMLILRRLIINQSQRLQHKRKALIEGGISELPEDSITATLEQAETIKQQNRLEQRIRRSRSGRNFLALGQVALWIWGVSAIFSLFPETRFLADVILSFPVQILIIVVVLSLAGRLCREMIHRSLQTRIEAVSIYGDEESRILLRAPTLEEVFNGITEVMTWAIGVIWFLIWQKVDLAASLTGAGIFGAALGLIFQNLVRDWLNGILIIFEDQYAVGDVVDINGTVGLVENMSIRATQLRAAGGRLSTIPHNQINIVHNLTKDWSRVDLAIEISNQADSSEAMAVMKQVSTGMQQDPEWQQDILDPVNLIGVSNVSAIGTQISMWIKTKRMRQWPVEREFRRRLKLAFEQQGIEIGVPQQLLKVVGNGN